MKHISRIIIALLIAAMIIPMAIACADPGDGTDTTGGSGNSGNENTAAETHYAQSNIPESLKFPGTTIRFLYWEDVEHEEFFVEDGDGDSVHNAIFSRNEYVKERFEVELEFIGTPGNYNNQAAFVNKCENSTESGADAYDLFCGYSMTGATLMTKGVAQDLTEYDIIEFDKPWWPETLISKAKINDGVYFASGDISTNFLYMMYGCFFNKDIYRDFYNDPSELYGFVKDKEWTLDKFIELSTGVFSEQNGDNVPSEGDRFGFVTQNIHFDSFFTASDLRTVDIDENGELKISDVFFTEKTGKLVEKLCSFIYDTEDVWKTNSATIFSEEQAMFTIDRVRLAPNYLKDVNFAYGILPIPLYDSNQENYRTCMAFPFTTYVLSTASPEPDAATATLELLAYQSYLNITPALFDEAMKIRYSEGGDDSVMYDIIRENVVIDIGRLLTTQIDNYSYSIFRNAVDKYPENSWATAQQRYGMLFKTKLKRINEDIAKLG